MEWDEIGASLAEPATASAVKTTAIYYQMDCVTSYDRTAIQEKADRLRKIFEEHPEWTDKQAGAAIGWDKNKTFYYRSRVLKLPDRMGRIMQRDTMTDPRQFD